MTHTKHTLNRQGAWACLFMLAVAVLMFWPQAAQAGITGAIKEGVCTSQPEYTIPTINPGEGLVSAIVQRIAEPLMDISYTVFATITGDPGFQNVIRLSSTLYVAIYGILFTFGMVQVTVYDLMMRFIKLGIMLMLLSGGGQSDIFYVLTRFFNDGVDDIIERVSNIAFGVSGGAIPGVTGAPFDPLDQALVYVVSSKMAIMLLATFATGPYGLVIGFILLTSLGSFLKSIFNALWVYVMALVVRTLLFGMAPIFIACILFQRSRFLFEGWLNQVVNTCLQAIFLFTFFAFFVTLLRSCFEILLERPICWMPTANMGESGTPNMAHFWRFAIRDCNAPDMHYIPFDGDWNFTGPAMDNDLKACNPDIHPIGIIMPLMIWILADLAGRFNHIVLSIAKQLADASTDFQGGADDIKKWFSRVTDVGGANTGGGSSGTTGNRSGPATLEALEKLVKDSSTQGARPAAAPGGPSLTGGRAGPGTVSPPGGSGGTGGAGGTGGTGGR